MTDPSRTSYYLTDAYYAGTVAAFTDWRTDKREIADPVQRDSVRRFLEREARLLDEHRLQDWLALFAPECVYWIPATPEAGDPRAEITVTFDDRRRLEDRVFRLETDATAIRVGDYDVSSVTPEDPIDEEGEAVDPEDPEEGYEVDE